MLSYMSEREGFKSFSASPCPAMASEPILLKEESASMSNRLSLF